MYKIRENKNGKKVYDFSVIFSDFILCRVSKAECFSICMAVFNFPIVSTVYANSI